MNKDINWTEAARMYRVRESSGHKGTFGRILIIAGSAAMQGAASLSAKAAAASGAGTVTLYTPKPAAKALRAKLDEIMILDAPSSHGWFAWGACDHLKPLLEKYDVILVGNGIGLSEGAERIVQCVLSCDKPVIVDADGITLLARHPKWLRRKALTLLTPHPGEARRLLQDTHPTPGLLMQFCREYPGTGMISKSSETAVFFEGKTAWIRQPNSALAKGGSGDVLAGMLTGILHYQKDPFESMALAAFLHHESAAGYPDNPAFLPSDILKELPELFSKLIHLKEKSDEI